MKSKTYVFSDSVLCLGGISPEPAQAWKDNNEMYLESGRISQIHYIGNSH